MVCELISVGTELLLGDIVNTNVAYLSQMCARLGLSVYYQSVVGDNEERMLKVIKTAVDRSDIVILSGGLGPTQDDITKDIAAAVMGRKLVEDAHTRARIQGYFDKLHAANKGQQVTENNWRQALIPEGSMVLDNDNGTAPGLIIEEGEKCIILLPGPPNELLPLFEAKVYPYIKKKQPEVIYSKMVKICGIGESAVETMIEDMIANQSNPTVAPYAKTGEVHLRITAKADNTTLAKELIKPVLQELKVRFGNYIYSTSAKKSLEDAIVQRLGKKGLSLTTAESCTGGAVAARLINVAGISNVYKEGFVTYSNRAKRKYLKVKKSTLNTLGAVSAKTAKEMAKGGCVATGADVCIAVTGIAGPDGGTADKPVGLVYIACCVEGKTKVQEHFFTGNRSRIREQSVVSALTLLRECIL